MVESLRPTGRRSYPATRNPSGAGAPAIRKEGLPVTITTRKAVLTTTPAIRKRVVGAPRRSSMSASDRTDPPRVRRHQSTDAVAVSDRTAANTATPRCHRPVRCARSLAVVAIVPTVALVALVALNVIPVSLVTAVVAAVALLLLNRLGLRLVSATFDRERLVTGTR